MMLGPRRGQLVSASKQERIKIMCFGGGTLPKTEIKYKKQDFGPLPSLKMEEDIKRVGPEYATRKTGQQQRSLLMPLGTSDG